ncbi:hypothetical protein [Curtobacterium sp. 458]|uniref:hypothetical protein n=1 Tax=Curtobacterium sp. 458 TaxID=3050069 RepID=UPI0025B28558|nr:hypothetical protein [Curtobacterium sp. 458]WJY00977.1 hypothetical protein QPJ90_04580 [Curtobacterium sp. 458]
MRDIDSAVEDMQALVNASLPHHGAQFVASVGADDYRWVQLDGSVPSALTLLADGAVLGSAEIWFRFRPGPSSSEAVVDASTFALFLDGERQPLLRFEYQEALTSTPPAHFHVHAERGAFSAMLTKAHGRTSGPRSAARLSSLHLPLGGPHFRTGLADFVEFLIEECGVDARPGWRSAVHEYRRDWRRDEAAATARQFPAETAEALRALGWTVDAPFVDWEQRSARAVSV